MTKPHVSWKDEWPDGQIKILATRCRGWLEWRMPVLPWDCEAARTTILKEWELKLDRPVWKWDADDWRTVALALASSIDTTHPKRGRPAELKDTVALISHFAEQLMAAGTCSERQHAVEEAYRELFNREIEPERFETLMREEREFRKKHRKKL